MQLNQKQINNFWNKVKKTNNCWEWQACKTPYGYGRFNIKGSWFLAHRVSKMLVGELPVEKNKNSNMTNVVMHICDNPACVNPEHLVVTTQKVNCQDALKKGRNYNKYKGENNPRTTLTNADVLNIRKKIECGVKQVEIAKEFRVTASIISNINTGKTFA